MNDFGHTTPPLIRREARPAPDPRRVLYFAENAISAIQGGGIVVYAVLKGLPPDQLLGFFEYRNITPAPEYADRFVHLGPWRRPALSRLVDRWRRRPGPHVPRWFTESAIARDLAFVQAQVEARGFAPDVVYFSGLSYRYLRLAVMAAEHYDIPMVLLHMDDWMQVEREAAGRWGETWHRRIVAQMRRAAERSLASTTNSPRLAERCTTLTGYRHVAANNCCSDLMTMATGPVRQTPRRVPVITYSGAMNLHLQGETLKVLASAVTELNAEGTQVHLHIYTPWEFAPQANAVAVPHAVFYKGQVGRERLADIFRRSDFLATTVTYREQHISLFRHSLSTKLSEYLCAGKPVISMGHRDWHLHEYVQEHGCGFSILMDEAFSRAAIKAQLRRILGTDPNRLADIGRRNRERWEVAHDVGRMALTTRRALRLDVPRAPRGGGAATLTRRGVLMLATGGGWTSVTDLRREARRLVDVHRFDSVDLVGSRAWHHPALADVAACCRDIGLEPTLVVDASAPLSAAEWSTLSATSIADVVLKGTAACATSQIAEAVRMAAVAGFDAHVRLAVSPADAPRVPGGVATVRAGGPASVALECVDESAVDAQALGVLGAAVADAMTVVDAEHLPVTIHGLPFCLLPPPLHHAVRHSAQRAYDARWPHPVMTTTVDAPPVLGPLWGDLIDRVLSARGSGPAQPSPVQRAVNALSVRVPRHGSRPAAVWLYGSAAIGADVIAAVKAHPWLARAARVAGFVASAGHRHSSTLQGLPLIEVGDLPAHDVDIVLVTSETSRLSIAEALQDVGLLERTVHLFGTASLEHRFHRDDTAPDVPTFGPEDYATRELLLRVRPERQPAPDTPCGRCALREICDGPLLAHTAAHGWSAFIPFEGPVLTDPRALLARTSAPQ